MSTDALYEKILRRSIEDVFVVATRRGLDIKALHVEFDEGRGPGPHAEHTLTIRLRDSSIAVSAFGIPDDWMSIGSGFIDSRLSRKVTSLLADLEKEAARQQRPLP